MTGEKGAIFLRHICNKNHVDITDEQITLLESYVSLLLQWNKKINLISRKDEEAVWESHILHSLSLLFHFNITKSATLVDLGTGGGLPGIPLKIARPDLSVTLIDATRKKIDAVQDMLQRLALQGIGAVWGRAEELGTSKEYQERFDLAVARGVAPLSDLVRWSLPLLRLVYETPQAGKNGINPREKVAITSPALIAFKGGELDEEVDRAMEVKGVKAIDVHPLVFHGSEQLLAYDKKVVYVQC